MSNRNPVLNKTSLVGWKETIGILEVISGFHCLRQNSIKNPKASRTKVSNPIIWILTIFFLNHHNFLKEVIAIIISPLKGWFWTGLTVLDLSITRSSHPITKQNKHYNSAVQVLCPFQCAQCGLNIRMREQRP